MASFCCSGGHKMSSAGTLLYIPVKFQWVRTFYTYKQLWITKVYRIYALGGWKCRYLQPPDCRKRVYKKEAKRQKQNMVQSQSFYFSCFPKNKNKNKQKKQDLSYISSTRMIELSFCGPIFHQQCIDRMIIKWKPYLTDTFTDFNMMMLTCDLVLMTTHSVTHNVRTNANGPSWCCTQDTLLPSPRIVSCQQRCCDASWEPPGCENRINAGVWLPYFIKPHFYQRLFSVGKLINILAFAYKWL